MLNSFGIGRGDEDEGEDNWVETVLLLCPRFVTRDKEGVKLTFVQYM